MLGITLRDATSSDVNAVLRLNADEEQWTSHMDADRLRELATWASYYRVAVVEETVVAFVLGMREGCGYKNANYEWFGARFDRFLYIDRIVVDRNCAGRGLGRALYADAFAVAKEQGAEYVVCEYTLAPLNAHSQKFHARNGFTEIGRRHLPASAKVVSMQCLKLDFDGRSDDNAT